MKTLTLLSLLLLCLSSPTHAQRAQRFHVRSAVSLRAPLPGDSINFKGERFAEKELLKTPLSLSFTDYAYTAQAADTAGVLMLQKADADNLLHLVATRLRADRFTKGSLHISSPVRFELFVDGKPLRTKESAEDSLKQVRPTVVPLTLNPEADREIVIKLLSAATDKLAPSVKVEYVADKAFADNLIRLEPDMKRRFALHNTVLGPRTSSVSLSPNGKYLLTRYSERFDKERTASRTELTEVKTGRVLLANAPAGAAWMPVGNKLYYTERALEGNNLLTYDPQTNLTETVLKGVPAGRFTWAPTEEYLIYSAYTEGEKVSGPLKRHLHPDDRIPGSRGRSYLVKYDPQTGLSERLTYGSASVYLNDIAPDGRTLLCTSSESDPTVHPYRQTTLFQLDLLTLKADTLIRRDGFLNSGAYSPDGKQLLLLGGPEALGGIGKNCGPLPIANDYDVQAYLYDLATRQAKAITRDFHPAIDRAEWCRADGCIYFHTTDKDLRTVYRYNPAREEFSLLPLQGEVIYGFSIPADNASLLAYTAGGSQSVGEGWLFDAKKQTSRQLAHPMKPILDEIQFGTIEPWNFTAKDGKTIEGIRCLPPDFDPQKKYPLIVYYYGGTSPSTRGMTSPYCAQLWAAHDYVVYVLNPSGTTGYGQEFSARHVNAWGDYTADEIIQGTKEFLAAHPYVDPARVGCCGASYGGFMTMYLQTKTDLFRAAISHAGISSVTSYWGEGYWGYSYNSVAAAKSYPWTRPDLLTRGALFQADKIKTPLLLLHGNADTNVPVGESIQLFNALRILGRPVEFITVDAQDHHILDYDKRIQWHNTMLAWFALHLQDAPAMWKEMYPERHW